ncbi:Putative divergent polysaccharide deacetylase [Marinobacter nitratireducens]|uniref:Divergent polysaccharide deacetylase n=1 Tax=Marinobacter nitratireducens TaxID=1137280 RepID=A0A072NBQ6_9GAMM|nr:Putative divergent polysaccharide deacetylase [Marinobacter nitratireducens]
MRFVFLLAALLATPVVTAGPDVNTSRGVPPTIAIIIDDMGHNRVEGERLIALDQPLTLAFLPYRRFTRSLAEQAHRNNKEIMLHAPMANTHNFGLGPGGLTSDMGRTDTIQTLRRALQSIPHVTGVNNHMGSLLTQRFEPMEWVMSELYNYPLYFVDSRTIASSIAADVAQAYQIPTMTRDVFLDHQQTEAFVDKQFRRLIKLARENGTAIAIGHPHKVTVDYLEKHLPELDRQGIGIATVSGIWALRNNNQEMFVEGEKQAITPMLARTPQDSAPHP